MSTDLHAAIARERARLWAICYRMTGTTSEADDLCQDAIARALERGDQVASADPTGWLLRIATTTCLDHLRRRTVERRLIELVDPLDDPTTAIGTPADDPERAAILRDDIRYAFVVALQHVAPRQRAALIVHDVCDRPLAEVADLLAIDVNAAKQLVHRARVAVAGARHRDDVDVPVDRTVVEALARAIEDGALDRLRDLLLEDAWGVVDGGGVVPVAPEPSIGRDAVLRRFANGWRRLEHVRLTAELRAMNGEPAVVVSVAASALRIAAIHVETRARAIAALRVDRSRTRLARLRA